MVGLRKSVAQFRGLKDELIGDGSVEGIMA